MARLDIRLSEGEKRNLVADAARANLSLSEYVRSRLFGVQQSADYSELLEDHERRLSRLEEMAGL